MTERITGIRFTISKMPKEERERMERKINSKKKAIELIHYALNNTCSFIYDNGKLQGMPKSIKGNEYIKNLVKKYKITILELFK